MPADNKLPIYRETRAQEIVEVLWSHPDSAWRGRINMLGESGSGSISQAAYIRALVYSYLRRAEGHGSSIGGLFGAELRPRSQYLLKWTRPQQAAFIMLLWQCMQESVAKTDAPWAHSLREHSKQGQPTLFTSVSRHDVAFTGGASLLARDQGVRGLLLATNDVFFVGAEELGLPDVRWNEEGIDEESEQVDALNEQAVNDAISTLREHQIYQFMQRLATEIANFDWRSSSAPGLGDDDRRQQMIFRGSGGYAQIREILIERLIKSDDDQIHTLAVTVQSVMSQ